MKEIQYCIYILFVSLLIGCFSHEEKDSMIDFAYLDELELELMMEIGEHAEYIPGLLGNLVLMNDGKILVSDLGGITIEQFNSIGEHVATVAREGRGPGELTSFFLLFRKNGDTLIVEHRGMYRQMDIFQKTNGGIYEHSETIIRENRDGMSVTLIGVLSDSTYLVRSDRLNMSTTHLLTNNPGLMRSPLIVTDIFGAVVHDSLNFLTIPLPVYLSGEGGVHFNTPPYQYRDRAKVINDERYFIARPGTDTVSLTIYNSDHMPEKKINISVKPRAVEQADMEYSFRNVNNREMRKELEDRIEKFKPAFLDIWVSDDFIWLKTDITKAGKKIIVLDLEGRPLGRLHLAIYDELQYVSNNQVYTIHKDPDKGHSIRIYQVNM